MPLLSVGWCDNSYDEFPFINVSVTLNTICYNITLSPPYNLAYHTD